MLMGKWMTSLRELGLMSLCLTHGIGHLSLARIANLKYVFGLVKTRFIGEKRGGGRNAENPLHECMRSCLFV